MYTNIDNTIGIIEWYIEQYKETAFSSDCKALIWVLTNHKYEFNDSNDWHDKHIQLYHKFEQLLNKLYNYDDPQCIEEVECSDGQRIKVFSDWDDVYIVNSENGYKCSANNVLIDHCDEQTCLDIIEYLHEKHNITANSNRCLTSYYCLEYECKDNSWYNTQCTVINSIEANFDCAVRTNTIISIGCYDMYPKVLRQNTVTD